MLLRRLLPVLLLPAAFGCRPPAPIVRQPVSLDDVSLEQIVKRNHANAKPFETMKAVAKLNVESKNSAGQFSMQMAVRWPDSVFIKIEGLLGIDGVKASINSNTFEVYNVIQRIVVKGRTNSAAIRQTLEYDLSFDELIDMLSGLPHLPDGEPSSLVADDTYFLLTYSGADSETKVWVDPYADFAISRVTQSQRGRIVLEKEYSRFEKINGRYVPRYVRLYRPLHKDLLSLYFDVRQYNKKIPSSIFFLHYPEDVKIVNADEH